MRRDVLFGCVSPKKRRRETELFRNIENKYSEDDLYVRFIADNTESISKRYNEIFDHAIKDERVEYVALMHDDIILDYDIRDQIIANNERL